MLCFLNGQTTTALPDTTTTVAATTTTGGGGGGGPSCGDGTCDAGENCNNCADCMSGTTSGAVCGNGVCETADGEDCVSCDADCNGKQNQNPDGRWCCGNGGDNPVGCGDPRCTSDVITCITTSASVTYCCGDEGNVCNGLENSSNCELDCGPTVSMLYVPFPVVFS